MSTRLDKELVLRGLVSTRSQAESYIKLGKVKVGKSIANKPHQLVSDSDQIELLATAQYVSRAALKLDSVAKKLGVNFGGAVILDVGSSTGGFTDYALRHGAKKVIAVDVGTNQLHPSLRTNPLIELHEQTDIRNFDPAENRGKIDIVLIDVSFISLREILPTISKIASKNTTVLAMLKPQFEAGANTKHKGVIKNDTMRRSVLKDFEAWTQKQFAVVNKADSGVSGAKGNQERFYILKKLPANNQS